MRMRMTMTMRMRMRMRMRMKMRLRHGLLGPTQVRPGLLAPAICN